MSALYNHGKAGVADQTIDWNAGVFLAVPVGSTYVVDQTHQFLSEITGELGGGTERVTLTGTSTSLNAVDDRAEFNLADPTFTAADFGDLHGVVIVQDDASDAARRLVVFNDGAGFPITTNGGDVTIDYPGWAFRF